MAHRIEKNEGLIEVHLSGEASLWEVLFVLRTLQQLAPRKEISDLWTISEEYVVPWNLFATIVRGIGRLIDHDTLPTKSAIVVSNQVQLMQAKFYQQEAKVLPYETGVFLSRHEAVKWLKS
jgi:hypothetical protein